MDRDDTIFYRIKNKKICQKICIFLRNLSNKYGKQLLRTAAKTALDTLKTALKSLVHRAAEATAEYIGNKTADIF